MRKGNGKRVMPMASSNIMILDKYECLWEGPTLTIFIFSKQILLEILTFLEVELKDQYNGKKVRREDFRDTKFLERFRRGKRIKEEERSMGGNELQFQRLTSSYSD